MQSLCLVSNQNIVNNQEALRQNVAALFNF